MTVELSGDDIELSREHNQALVSCGAGGRMIYLHFHVHNDPDHMFHDDQPSIWRKPQEISTYVVPCLYLASRRSSDT